MSKLSVTFFFDRAALWQEVGKSFEIGPVPGSLRFADGETCDQVAPKTVAASGFHSRDGHDVAVSMRFPGHAIFSPHRATCEGRYEQAWLG
jgi:hypothetical protein